MFSVAIFLSFVLSYSVRGEPCGGAICECTRGDTPERIVKIDCSNRKLTEIPAFTTLFQGELELVDFSGNNLVTFDPFDFGFQFIGVTSINVLDLSNNQLMSIANAFAVTNMSPQYDVLNMSSNNFDVFPNNAFPRGGLSNIELIVDISNNRLTSLPMNFIGDYTAKRIPTLRFNARNNLIDTIDPMAFSNAGISDLFLDVSGNRLSNLSSDFDFPESNNNGFNMSDNPWNCDCNFRWVISSYLRKAWRSLPPLCYEPLPIRDMPLFELRPDDFVCKPVANDSYDDIVIESGDNILECPATADPQSTLGITWQFILPCFDKPLTLIADSRVATINDVTCFPQANVSCTASNYGGSVDVALNVLFSADIKPCPGGVGGRGGSGGFFFLIILVVLSFIVLLVLAGYYWYLLREIPSSKTTKSNHIATAHYSNNSRANNPTRPTRSAPQPPSYR